MKTNKHNACPTQLLVFPVVHGGFSLMHNRIIQEYFQHQVLFKGPFRMAVTARQMDVGPTEYHPPAKGVFKPNWSLPTGQVAAAWWRDPSEASRDVVSSRTVAVHPTPDPRTAASGRVTRSKTATVTGKAANGPERGRQNNVARQPTAIDPPSTTSVDAPPNSPAAWQPPAGQATTSGNQAKESGPSTKAKDTPSQSQIPREAAAGFHPDYHVGYSAGYNDGLALGRGQGYDQGFVLGQQHAYKLMKERHIDEERKPSATTTSQPSYCTRGSSRAEYAMEWLPPLKS
ncbi:hypothetical protein BT63DRAFT_66675 [Microthyrium microscopicum]|uniref:Uncharacterized protein n=1 Tax=Microthyrium microscopicum TaxID=703497 RepID=A0A6A6U0K2_9PEZI|nr:hypothetical protein BT63DRAFT_66675 [Microthyrium microscopicum]